MLEQIAVACDKGDGDSCNAAADRVEDHATKLTLYSRGCAAGSTYACTDLASMQMLGLDPAHGRLDGLKLLADICERTGAIETCAAARGYVPWRWYRGLHGMERPNETFTPMSVSGEVHGPPPQDPNVKGWLTWIRFCTDPAGAVERAEYVFPSARPERDALLLAMISKWRIDRVTSVRNPCWVTSFRMWYR